MFSFSEFNFEKVLLVLGICIQFAYTQISVTTSRSFLYGNSTQQVLDLYKPSSGSEESPKIIILVPGESDGIKYKEDYAFIIPFLQARFPSYAFVNVNYRLNETKFVDQSQDIMQVVLFLRTIEEYKTANFGFIGSTKIEEDFSGIISYFGMQKCTFTGPKSLLSPSFEEFPVENYVLLTLSGDEPCPSTIADRTETTPISYRYYLQPTNRANFFGNRITIIEQLILFSTVFLYCKILT